MSPNELIEETPGGGGIEAKVILFFWFKRCNTARIPSQVFKVHRIDAAKTGQIVKPCLTYHVYFLWQLAQVQIPI